MTATSVGAAERRTIVGVFNDAAHAERALSGLQEAGLRPDQVSVVARNTTDTAALAGHTNAEDEDSAAGAVTGGLLGGLAGFLIGISALVIPGIGPIVGSGIIVATIVGAGIGAGAGELVGALAEQGVPEGEARGYQEQVQGGRILLTVHAATDDEARAAQRVLRGEQGDAVRAYGTGAAQAAMARLDQEDSTEAEEVTSDEVTPDIEGETMFPTSTSVGAASGIGMGPGAAATLTDMPTAGAAREAERRS